MKKLAFCEYCINENEYKVRNINKTSMLSDEEINYVAKDAICNICGNEVFVSDICDYNLDNLYSEYRKKHNLISINEIKHILIQYSIDEEALSLLLGWRSNTINRYLDGDMIGSSHSEILKKIYEEPDHYSNVLKVNKGRINPISYNKSRQAVKDILKKKVTETKIDAVIKYILIKCEDFAPVALHNLLYYVQGFCYAFTNNFIFEEDCIAYIGGPVYKSVFERYEKFGYEKVNKDILDNKNLIIDDVERDIVENVIKFYGCYSGKVLKQMTRNEAPWLLKRTKINNINHFENDEDNIIIDKKLISEYFNGIKYKYNMTNVLDIQKYSTDSFNKYLGDCNIEYRLKKEGTYEDDSTTY